MKGRVGGGPDYSTAVRRCLASRQADPTPGVDVGGGISKMKKIITSIITESADSTKSFTAFIGHEKYNDLPTDWKNSRYVKYGPYHDHMQEELNWAIMKGMHPTNVVEKQWHDFRHNDVINEEAAEILQGIDYSKRMLKSGDVVEVKLYPVEIVQ